MRLEFCLFFVRWCFAIVLLAVAALASLNLGVCIDIWMVMACLAVFLVDWRVTFLSARYRYHVIVKVLALLQIVDTSFLGVAATRPNTALALLGRARPAGHPAARIAA